MERIIDALSEAKIPFHSREARKSGFLQWLLMPMWLFCAFLGFFTKPPIFELQIDVFQKDIARANEFVRDAEKADSFDDEDEEGQTSSSRPIPK